MDFITVCSTNAVFNGFTKHQQTLSCIREDTIKLLKAEKKAKQNETCLNDQLLQSILYNKFAIVISGHDYESQCKCLNWLLGESLLPVENKTWIAKGCSITFKYSKTPQLAFKTPDGTILSVKDGKLGQANLSESLISYVEKCLPSKKNEEDESFFGIKIKAIKEASIEIFYDVPLLKENLSVVIKGTRKEVLNMFHTECYLLRKIIPIYVHVLESDGISEFDINVLNKINKARANSPVLFWVNKSSRSSEYSAHCDHLIVHKHIFGAGKVMKCLACNINTSCNVNSARTEVLPYKGSYCQSCWRLRCNSHNREPLKDIENFHNLSLPTKVQTRSNYDDQFESSNNNNTTFPFVSLRMHELMLSLEELGFNFDPASSKHREIAVDDLMSCYEHSYSKEGVSLLCPNDGTSNLPAVPVDWFFQRTVRLYLTYATKLLNKLHREILEGMISEVSSLSHYVMITPARIAYARKQEEILYSKLLEIATHKQKDITQIIATVKKEHAKSIVETVKQLHVNGGKHATLISVSEVSDQIQNIVLNRIVLAAAERLTETTDVLSESMTGTLSRCIEHLETTDDKDEDFSESGDQPSRHLERILNAAYKVEVSIRSSSGLLSLIINKIRQMLRQFSWKDVPVMDSAWKQGVAEGVLKNLCEHKLAKTICSQLQSQLQTSHKAFLDAMKQIETRQNGRIERDEGLRKRTSKIVAPSVAQLALRSRSLMDEILYGMPDVGREIGRGMYGVVFSCKKWTSPLVMGRECAVKSVLPHDEKHWNDLSLEFYYSMSLPPHSRIVQLFGSVVDESYGSGASQPAVLLVMEKLSFDLYFALKNGIEEKLRMNIALDVVDGIRYLHSRNLVHRDIKLQNVLLDEHKRAKISDLGFCKPNAMMSGSIVGTPIHMSPDLLSGDYDSSVDIYAFGILFWSLCSGTVNLPKNYTACSSKNVLWKAVKNGTRPEQLSCFHPHCWKLMTDCWDREPSHRPLPGILRERLKRIITDHKLN